MAQHRKEATVYFAVDGEKGYYIGSTEWPDERRREHELDGRRVIEEFDTTRDTRYSDEYGLIEFAEGMGVPLTNSSRKRHGNFKWIRRRKE